VHCITLAALEFIVMALNPPMPMTVKTSALSGHYSRSISIKTYVHSGRSVLRGALCIYGSIE